PALEAVPEPVPQNPTYYPPAFRSLQQPQNPVPGWPAPAIPGTLGTEGFQNPAWTPPVLAPPSQAPQLPTLAPGLLTVGAGKLFEVHPTLSLTEEWTNNFNQTSTNMQEDWRTVFGPGAIVLINGPTTKGSLAANAGLTYDTASGGSG